MGLSTKNKEILFNPVNKNNPVIVQMLGICSALAVTVKLQPAIVMTLSVIAVVAFANVIISLLRKTIPYPYHYPARGGGGSGNDRQ